MNWSIFWDAMSAIATTAAVIVALDLALKEQRRSESKDLQIARLSAASISLSLSGVASEYRAMLDACAAEYPLLTPTVGLRRKLVLLQDELKKPRFKPSAADMIALIPLEDSCAHRIAMAYDTIRGIADSIDQWDAEDMTVEELGDVVENIEGLLTVACWNFEAAVSVCDKAALIDSLVRLQPNRVG